MRNLSDPHRPPAGDSGRTGEQCGDGVRDHFEDVEARAVLAVEVSRRGSERPRRRLPANCECEAVMRRSFSNDGSSMSQVSGASA